MTASSSGVASTPLVQVVLGLASRVPLPLASLRRVKDVGCVVMVSHAVVTGSPPPHLEWIVPCKTAAHFASDLAWLQRHYHFVSYADVEASLTGNLALPRNAALLTFDDGYAELYSVVWPILRERGVPALGFLTTSQVDNQSLSADCRASLCVHAFLERDRAEQGTIARHLGLPDFAGSRADAPRRAAGRAAAESAAVTGHELRAFLRSHETVAQALGESLGQDEKSYLRTAEPYLTSDQVHEMTTVGWSFGAHATVHRPLQGLSEDELESEIVVSCGVVNDLTGQDRAPFAFPYTGEGIPRERLAAIRAKHPEVGLFFDVWGLKREDSLVWHRVAIEDPRESVATAMRRAYLVALVRR